MKTAGLAIKDVGLSYGSKTILRSIRLQVAPGKIACLLGPSGCGKTTLLRIIAGLERPHNGRITLSGHVVTDVKKRLFIPVQKRRVGMVFQDCALFPHLNVLDNILFGVKQRRNGRYQWAMTAMERLGIGDYRNAWPDMVSGGQQQRVALLRALAGDPDILLLDEPFSGLDAGSRSRIREQTLDLLAKDRTTVLMVTHDPEEAMFMADQIFVMNPYGDIVQAGTPAETWLGPLNSYVAELFGPINRFRGSVRDGIVKTAIGTFAALGLNEGMKVDVLVRPDGISIDADDRATTIHARVLSARLIGRFSHLRLEVDGHHHPLHARISGVVLPAEQARVAIVVEKCSVFVFLTESQTQPKLSTGLARKLA